MIFFMYIPYSFFVYREMYNVPIVVVFYVPLYPFKVSFFYRTTPLFTLWGC